MHGAEHGNPEVGVVVDADAGLVVVGAHEPAGVLDEAALEGISVRAPVGLTNLAPCDCAIGRGLASLRPQGGIASWHVLYWLRASQRELASRGTGTTFAAISGAVLREHPIPLPPLAEQRRIVVAIEEHFSRLDAAEASLRRARNRAISLRKTIRSLAVAEGVERSLGELLDGIEAGKSFKCDGRPAAADEWGVIKVSAMTWGSFDDQENKAVTTEDRIDPRWEIKPGDLLLSRANTSEYVGASVLVRTCRGRLLLSDKSMRLLVRQDIDKSWLHLALNAPESSSDVRRRDRHKPLDAEHLAREGAGCATTRAST